MYMYMYIHNVMFFTYMCACIHAVVENYRTTWHLLNIRIPWLREYALNYIRKGSRLLINGRLEYTQSTKEDGTVKDHTIIVVGELWL